VDKPGDAAKTLAGLRGVYVAVAPLPDAARQHGLSEDRIQADVEAQVRQAGIAVLKKDDLRRTPGMPYLVVQPNVERSQATGSPYAYHVEVGLFQLVVLTRNPDLFSLAQTWNSAGGLGAAGDENLATSTTDAVRSMIDQFIAAYLGANPKH
jgi:hypothetical protein